MAQEKAGLALTRNALAALLAVGALSVVLVLLANPLAGPGNKPAISANTTQGGTGMALGAQKGNTVEVDYLGTLDNGTVFDTSLKEEAEKAGLPLKPSYSPLKFTVGAGQMIKGFDNAVVGMKEGEEKTVTIAAADAYGEVRQDLLVSVSLDKLPNGTKVGVQLQTNSGMVGTVTKIEGGNATVDFNHQLAGQRLTFKIIMRKISA